ncbi:MAG: outer membrane beta-barrel protein [Bacteroidota bacterium]
MDNNIDKLFKDGLAKDNPPFKEEYWQNFEKMFNAAPAAGTSVTNTGLNSVLGSITFTKGIIAIVSVVAITSLVYFGIKNTRTDPPAQQFTAMATDSSVSNNENKNTNAKSTNQFQKSSKNPSPENTGKQLYSENSNPQKQAIQKQSSNSLNIGNPRKNAANPTAVSAINSKEKTVVIKTNSATEKIYSSESGIQQNKPNFTTNQAKQSAFSSQDNLAETPAISKDQENNKPLGETISEKNTVESTPAINKENNPKGDSEKTENNSEKTASQSITAVRDSTEQTPESTAINPAIPVFDIKKDSKLKFFVVPGIALFNTIGNTTDFNPATRTAFQFGLGISYKFNENLSLCVEGNVLKINGFKFDKSSIQTDYLFNEWMSERRIENRGFAFLNVPVLLTYHLNHHNFTAGPTVRYLLSSTGEKTIRDSTLNILQYSNSKADNYLSGFNRFQAGLALEYSYEFYHQNAILIRYTYLLNYFNDNNYYAGSKNEKLNSLFIAFRFRIY